MSLSNEQQRQQDNLSTVTSIVNGAFTTQVELAKTLGASASDISLMNNSLRLKGGALGVAEVALAANHEGVVGGIDKAIDLAVGTITGIVTTIGSFNPWVKGALFVAGSDLGSWVYNNTIGPSVKSFLNSWFGNDSEQAKQDLDNIITQVPEGFRQGFEQESGKTLEEVKSELNAEMTNGNTSVVNPGQAFWDEFWSSDLFPGNNDDSYSEDSRYDAEGYDQYGYDQDGFDREGYDAYGYNRDGVDAFGYDRFNNFYGDPGEQNNNTGEDGNISGDLNPEDEGYDEEYDNPDNWDGTDDDWDDSGDDSSNDQEDTDDNAGLGDSEWDSSDPDFSWDDASDTNEESVSTNDDSWDDADDDWGDWGDWGDDDGWGWLVANPKASSIDNPNKHLEPNTSIKSKDLDAASINQILLNFETNKIDLSGLEAPEAHASNDTNVFLLDAYSVSNEVTLVVDEQVVI